MAGWGEAGGGVYGEGGEGGEGAAEAEEVVDVAEDVEGFVWVFDCDFGGCGDREGVGEHRVVEVGAVGAGLVGGRDEELGDALAGGEGGGGECVG